MIFYKKKRRIFWWGSVLVIFILVLCELKPKSGDVISTGSIDLIFSKEPGFYEEAFELELITESGTIYYTLDGTTPDNHSMKYESPILISDATENDNLYSMRTDVSTGFEKEEIEKVNSDYPGYQIPDFKIDKATIVCAVVYDDFGNYSDVKTATYFVGYSHKDGYEGMKILSIITDPANLFDYENGIYVTGKTYDEYVKEYRGKEYYWREEFWTLWSANYRNRGMKWERNATCQFFNDNILVLDQKCGIRIHGGASRGYNPKSLNLYARESYDGNKYLNYDLFGTGYYASAVTLSQGGNDTRTKAKDYLVSASIKDLQIAAMNYEPYILFLNGEYWGMYWLNEKYNTDYLAQYYNVSKDNVIMIKEGILDEGDEEDYKYYSKMIEFCSETDTTKEANYKRICELIDIESYTDYYAVMLFIGRNADWPTGNFALWRVKKSESGPYGDGKWRWMIFDLNSPGFSPEFDSIQYTIDNDAMFKNLMRNDMFRTQLICKIEQLANTSFSGEVMGNRINEYIEFASGPMKVNDRRFFNDDSLDIFYKEMEELKIFFVERMTYLNPVLDSYR